MRAMPWYMAVPLAVALLGGCDDTPRPELSPEADAGPVIGAPAGQVEAPPMKRGVVKVGDLAPRSEEHTV